MIKNNICYDHLGNQYSCFTEMCKTYGKERVTVAARLRRGYNLEEALTKETDKRNTPKICKDHLGNLYSSFAEMCKTYNKKVSAVRSRLRRGLSLRVALTEKEDTSSMAKECKDHLGKSYKSFKQMCKNYNKSVNTVLSRLDKGWSLEAALTKKANTGEKGITIFGAEYSSISKALSKYNINKGTLRDRLKSKWDIELAFIYPVTPRIRFGYIGIDGKARYKLGNSYYTTEELIAKYVPEYLDLYRRTSPQGIYHLFEE